MIQQCFDLHRRIDRHPHAAEIVFNDRNRLIKIFVSINVLDKIAQTLCRR